MKNIQITSLLLEEIDVSHHDDSCFHYLTEVGKTSFLSMTPLYVSIEDKKLYGVSLSVYHALKRENITQCISILIPGKYNEKFDFYLQNISSNVTLLYNKIKQKYSQATMLNDSEFDINQLDLMYLVELDDATFDIRELSEETVKIKKQFNITIVLKTLEQNFLVQKFFKTNVNEISYNHFNRIVNNIVNPFDDEVPERFYKTNTYPDFVIKCESYEQLNSVLDYFKINKDKIKTTRLNFKKIERFFK